MNPVAAVARAARPAIKTRLLSVVVGEVLEVVRAFLIAAATAVPAARVANNQYAAVQRIQSIASKPAS